jgi:hypothetical protein
VTRYRRYPPRLSRRERAFIVGFAIVFVALIAKQIYDAVF